MVLLTSKVVEVGLNSSEFISGVQLIGLDKSLLSIGFEVGFNSAKMMVSGFSFIGFCGLPYFQLAFN